MWSDVDKAKNKMMEAHREMRKLDARDEPGEAYEAWLYYLECRNEWERAKEVEAYWSLKGDNR